MTWPRVLCGRKRTGTFRKLLFSVILFLISRYPVNDMAFLPVFRSPAVVKSNIFLAKIKTF